MKSWFFVKRKPIALMVMTVLLFTSVFTGNFKPVKAEDSKTEFVSIDATAASGTEFKQENVNGADFILSRNGSKTLSYESASIKSTGWDEVGSYWQMQFSTSGYQDLELNFKSRSSKTGPKNFEVQYSTDGTNFVSVEGSSYAISEASKLDYFSSVVNLPESASNTANLYIRVVTTDTTSVKGETILSAGVSNINNISVKGNPCSSGGDQGGDTGTTLTATITANPASGTTVTKSDLIGLSASNVQVTTGSAISANPVTGSAIDSQPATGTVTLDESEYKLIYQVGSNAAQEYSTPISVAEIADPGDTFTIKAYVQYNETLSTAETFTYSVEMGTFDIGKVRKGTEGKTYQVEGTVTFVDGRNVYVEDSTGGINLYCTTANTTVKAGNRVTATGTKSAYKGLEQLKDAELTIVSSDVSTITPIAISDISNFISNYNDYECRLVTLDGLVLQKIAATGETYVLDRNGNQIILYKAGTDMLGDLKAGDLVNVTGVVSDYNNKLQLRFGDFCSITAAESGVSTIAEAKNMDQDSQVKVHGVVNYIDENRVFIEDASGGLVLSLSAADSALAIGNYIMAEGKVTKNNQSAELSVAAGSYSVYAAFEPYETQVTVADLLANPSSYEGRRVLVKNAVLGTVDTNGNTELKQENSTVSIYKLPANEAFVKGTKVSVTAVVLIQDGEVQLRVVNASDVEVEQEVVPIYDPVAEDLFTDGVLHLSEVYTSSETQVTTIGQVVTKYGSKGTLDSIILEDVIENEIVGLQLYDKSKIAQYNVGDIVKVTGTRDVYGDVAQLKDITAIEVVKENVQVIEPQRLTIAQLQEGKDAYLSEYVWIKDVTLGEYSEKNTSITDSTGSINIYRGAAYDGVAAGDVVDVYGVWSKYSNTYQLRVGESDCYHATGSYAVDETIVLPLVSWGGTSTTGYNTTTIYGDLNQANDQLDQEAQLTVSTGEIPKYSYTSDGVTGYCIGSKGLLEGQYYQMTFGTKGYGSLDLSFTMRGSKTGAKYFNVLYSTDGINFEKSNQISYTISTKNWTTGETTTNEYINQDKLEVTDANVDYYVELPASLNHCDKIYIRVQVASSESIKGETIATGGVNRFTNIAFTANPVISDDICGAVEVTPGAGQIGLNSELTMKTNTAGAEIYYKINDGSYQLYDSSSKPVITELPATVSVYAQKEGKDNSIVVTYGYTQAKVVAVKASPNGGAVKQNTLVTLTCATEGASIQYSMDDGATWKTYTESIKLEQLPVTIKAKATLDGYLDSEEKTFDFTKRLNEEYNIYFGQIHSHTEYSDGAGTCEQAFEYASTKAENIDFLAVTDHSNSFDNDTSATIKDGSVSSEWVEGHQLADQYTNTEDPENLFVGIYGYEMTWSGGAPGHMNTYNTDGFLSRNMDGYKNGSAQSLPNYYTQLKTVPDSISMFNHPGTTFGDFYDFGYYDEEIDNLITLIEVGNGEGAIGSTGYFPSYEYYTRALDKGWHVAPTNNQDNHKGKWGDANTGRTVILADSLTRDNIYDALRNMRTYATEDDDLKIWYTLNGSDMGTIFEEAPDTVQIQVKVEDPTDSAIGKIDVVVNGGLTVASDSLNSGSGTVDFELDPSYSYYYIRITQPDGDLAVTAPVWISEVEAVGISSITTTATLAVEGEPIDITTTLYNNEETDFQVDSIVYSIDGQIIRTTDVAAAGLSVVKSQKEVTDTFEYTHNGLGKTEITVTVLGKLNGVAKQYSSVLQLSYVSPDMVTRVLVDGTHNNDYVNGYYGGNVGNFADLASEDYVQVEVVKDQFTKEMLDNCSLLIVSAPAKKTGTYDSKAYGISHFEDDFIQLVTEYVANGGNIIVCGLADYQDSADGQSSTEINKLLEAIGASMRLNSDELVDDVSNGGQNYRLYFDDFNHDSKYLTGVTSEQTYSAYSGCSILLDSEKVAAGLSEALVWGHDTTYSIDSKKLDNNYVECEKGTLVALGHETLPSGGNVFAAGTVFLSDFEVKTDLDNASESYYANRNILLNILGEVKKELPTSPISEMRKGEVGNVFAIEGWVTAGTAVEGNAFFDTIYVQDETAGTTVFPIADAGIKIGTKIRIVGYVDGYQGDKEIQVIQYEILDSENLNVIPPMEVTTAQAADYDALGGSLLKVTGTVTRVVTNTAGVDYFYLKDTSGVEARVFIDGYILASDGDDTVNSDIKVGNEVSAVGLSYFNPDGSCLRVRDRAEIVLVKAGTTTGTSQTPAQESDPKDIITSAIKDSEESQEEVKVSVDLSKTGILSKEVINLLRNTLVTVAFDLGNGVTCTIRGASIQTEAENDIDLTVVRNGNRIPEATLSGLFGDSTKQDMVLHQVSLNHDGVFGFDAEFTYDLSEQVKGLSGKLYAGLYYYDQSNGRLILQAVSKLTNQNLATFIKKHASDYVIAISDHIIIDEDTLSQVRLSGKTGTTKLYVGGTTSKTKQLSIELPEALQQAVDAGILSAKVKYSTSDKSVAVVSKAGKISARGTGKAVIRATVTIDGKTIELEKQITVKKASIKLVIDTKQISIGEKYTVRCEVYGYKKEDIIWTTKKADVAVVGKNAGKKKAVVTGKTEGKDTVVVKVKNTKGNYVTAESKITVTK